MGYYFEKSPIFVIPILKKVQTCANIKKHYIHIYNIYKYNK